MGGYIAFLRGINLGQRRLKMGDLAGLFTQLKFRNVATFIASGNVIFDSPARDSAKLERQIEQHLEASLGYAVDTFVRSRAELAAIATSTPFPAADMDAAFAVNVGFLKQPLPAEIARRLAACRTAVDAFHVQGREFYWLCRIRTSESEVWASPALRALKLPTSSMRNLTTVRKLAALYPPAPNAA